MSCQGYVLVHMISNTSSFPDILSTALEISAVSHNPALDEALLCYIPLPILTAHLLAQNGASISSTMDANHIPP